MSMRPTVDAGSAGVIRRPAVLWPATRSEGMTLNLACRPASESGTYDGPDDTRISLFERLGTALDLSPL